MLQHLAGNAAVIKALRQPPSAAGPAPSESPVIAVQRHAWVKGKHVDPSASSLTQEMRKLALDDQIHDYHDDEEFRAHVEGRTDYLGNLPDEDKTWVRFSPDGLNVIGESHVETTLPDVVRAVGTRSFIYEMFPIQDLSSHPVTLEMFKQVSADRIERLGIKEDESLQKYGAESIFPKIGYAFTILLKQLNDGSLERDVDLMSKDLLYTEGSYLDHTIQRHLQIAWAYARDVHKMVESRRSIARAAGRLSARRRAEERVAQSYTEHNVLRDFIRVLKPKGALANSLSDWTKEQNSDKLQRLLPELKSFVLSIIELMRKKVGETPGLNLLDRAMLGLTRDSGKKFEKARDLSFRASVLKALKDRVRYAGMGSNHTDALRKELSGRSELHFYDLNGDDLRKDISFTKRRRRETAKNRENTERKDQKELTLSAPSQEFVA